MFENQKRTTENNKMNIGRLTDWLKRDFMKELEMPTEVLYCFTICCLCFTLDSSECRSLINAFCAFEFAFGGCHVVLSAAPR